MTYDKVPREVFWKTQEKKAIKDMYNEVKISARIQDVVSKYFSFFHRITARSILCPYLLTLVLDVHTEHIQKLLPQSVLYVDDIILVRDSREKLNDKLEMWRQTLEAHRFRISRSKTKYMKCKFIKGGDHIIPKSLDFGILDQSYNMMGKLMDM
ncbi:hypothetical protein Lal_00017827 [Lupinus albus]|nr:hypothetical protein Lal_00017827 [Lupinus albus]